MGQQPLTFTPKTSADIQAIIHTPGLVDIIKGSLWVKVDFVDFQEDRLSEGTVRALVHLRWQTFTFGKQLFFANIICTEVKSQIELLLKEFWAPIDQVLDMEIGNS